MAPGKTALMAINCFTSQRLYATAVAGRSRSCARAISGQAISDANAADQCWTEFGSNSSDDLCGIALREAIREQHLIGQGQGGCEILRKHGAGARLHQGGGFPVISGADDR